MTAQFFVALTLLAASRLAMASDITVSAAASLTNAFKAVGQHYEKQYPGSQVAFNFGASGALVQQIAKGAPVDVLATADQESMDLAGKQGLLKPGERRDFVRNRLVLVVPANAANKLQRLGDLTLPQVKRIAVGLPASVPVGRYARLALEQAKLWTAIEPKVIHTQNVRQSLDYVVRGEVDAGFVYATDAALVADKVRIAAEVATATPILYPVAVVAQTAHGAEAKRFSAYIASPEGQAILAKFGFARP